MDHGGIRPCNVGLVIRKDCRHRDAVGFMKIHLHDKTVRRESAINAGFVFIDCADANPSKFRKEVDKVLK